MADLVTGERLAQADFPLADLAPQRRPQFVVRDGNTYLLCAQREDGTQHFPCNEQAACVEVGPEGLLYSHSTVHVSSSRETPYTIGYVDFPSGLRVLASVRGARPGLGCDVPVRLGHDQGDWFVEPVGQEPTP